jgi:hypothetical protein
MRRTRIAALALVSAAALVGGAPRLFAGDGPPVGAPAAAPADPAALQRLVEDLGSADFRIREAATKALIDLGESARAALVKAAQSDNPAVRFRADQILQRLDGTRGEKPLADGTDPRGAERDGKAPDDGKPGAGPIDRTSRDWEQRMRELQKQWSDGHFDEQMKDIDRRMRAWQEQMQREVEAWTRGFGPGGGAFGPDIGGRFGPGRLSAALRARRPLRAEVETDASTLGVEEGPRNARLEIRSKQDGGATASFSGRSLAAILETYPTLRQWPGVADLLAKFEAAKLERAKAEEEARKASPAAPPGGAQNRSIAIQSTDGHVRVEIVETGPDGKPVTKTYEGTDLEALKAAHPELREALGGMSVHFGTGNGGFTWGGLHPLPPMGPGGVRPLTPDDDGDEGDDDGAGEPGAMKTGPFGLALGAIDAETRAPWCSPSARTATRTSSGCARTTSS